MVDAIPSAVERDVQTALEELKEEKESDQSDDDDDDDDDDDFVEEGHSKREHSSGGEVSDGLGRPSPSRRVSDHVQGCESSLLSNNRFSDCFSPLCLD